MSADVDIELWLSSHGFALPEAKRQARAALEDAILTRRGKQRVSVEKLERIEALLAERFALHCGAPDCRAHAQASGRIPVPCDPKSACERCGGSPNAAAATTLLEVCRRRGVRRLVVVGGSPAVRQELGTAIGDGLDLRMIDGTERRTQDRARGDVEWADLVLVWGGSELHHKVSLLYTHVPSPLRKKVVQVARRGVAALLSAAVKHFEGH
ncbi:MAG TPA: hypothetical protein VE618_05085 [Myxococcaceae bacterium]|nr:hypothetical protein [Myxococcaceae bacterium]